MRLKLFVVPLVLLLAGMAFFLSQNIRVAYFSDSSLQPTLIHGDGFPKILIDATGEEHVLRKAPERIVSVTLGADEMLSALVAPSRVVGVTFLADNPDISNIPNQYPSSIQRINGEVEEVLALEPDLAIVVSYTRAETVRQLLGAGVPVVRLSGYQSFTELEQNIRLVGQATGNEKKAAAIIAERHRYVQNIKDRVKGLPVPRVLFYDFGGYTSGADTVIDEMIQLAGGYNVVRDVGMIGAKKIEQEMALGLEPDVILMGGWSELSDKRPSELLMSNPNWQFVPAVQNNRVYDMKGYWTLSVSQFGWNGVGEIAKRLHPGAFEQ